MPIPTYWESKPFFPHVLTELGIYIYIYIYNKNVIKNRYNENKISLISRILFNPKKYFDSFDASCF